MACLLIVCVKPVVGQSEAGNSQKAPVAQSPVSAASEAKIEASPPRATDDWPAEFQPLAEGVFASLVPAGSDTAAWHRQAELAENRLKLFEGVAADADTPAGARKRAWTMYRDRVAEALQVREDVAILQRPAAIAEASEELSKIEATAQTIREQALPEAVPQSLLTEYEAELSKAEARRKTLQSKQQERSVFLDSGVAATRRDLDARLQALAGRMSKGVAGGAATAGSSANGSPAANANGDDANSAPEDPTALTPVATQRVTRTRLIEQAALTVARNTLPLMQQRVELSFQRDQRLLSAVQVHEQALRQFATQLIALRSTSLTERLKKRYAKTNSPVEKAAIRLRLFVERTKVEQFTLAPDWSQRPDELLFTLSAQLPRSQERWAQSADSLMEYSGERLQALLISLREDTARWQTRRRELRGVQEQAVGQLHQLERARVMALDRFAELEAKLLAEMKQGDPSQAQESRLDALIAEQRLLLRESSNGAVARVSPLVERLHALAGDVHAHLNALWRQQANIRWQRLQLRDSGILATDWQKAGRELAGLWSGLRAYSETAEAQGHAGDGFDDLRLELADRKAETARRGRRVFARWGDALRTWPTWRWGELALGLVIAVLGGWAVRRLARSRGAALAHRISQDVRRAAENPEAGSLFGVSARIHLMLLNMMGDLLLLLLIGAVLLWATHSMSPTGEETWLATVVLGSLFGAAFGQRFVHHLFEPDFPAHRVVPCDDKVARHYRSYATWLAIWFVLTALPATKLRVLDLAPTLSAAWMELFVFGVLVLALGFLRSKHRAVGFELRQPAWWVTLLVILRPLLLVLGMVLLLLQIAGYGALTVYVGSGVAGSLLLLMGLLLAGEYLIDLLEHQFQSARSGADAGGVAAVANMIGPVGLPQQVAGPFVLSLSRTLIRLAVVVGLLTGVSAMWRIDLEPQVVSSRVLGLSALLILVGIVLERVVFVALHSLSRAGRLPASTISLIVRWVRAMFILVVVLGVAAIAGFQIESLWTFLTTILAMIAIGFVAVWSILSNLLATLVILIWRPFNVGDDLEIQPENLSGRVIDINFMYTILRTENEGLMSIPNNFFAQKFITRRSPKKPVQRSLAEQLEAETPIDEASLR